MLKVEQYTPYKIKSSQEQLMLYQCKLAIYDDKWTKREETSLSDVM